MKYLLCLMVCLMAVIGYSFELKTIDGVPIFAKWQQNNNSKIVWTDVERDDIISQSSGTLTTDDFTNILPNAEDQEIIDGISADSLKLMRSDYFEEIALRKSMTSQELADYRKIIKWAKKKK